MLIIYAHPNKDGHCGYILKKVKEKLKRKKINFEILDLYEINYDPTMKNSEHYTSGHYDVNEKNKKIQEKIRNERKFIFIYPTWWNNVPAILKGFIDRIFTSRFAFKYVKGIPFGLLTGKAVIFTSSGSPKILYYLILRARSIKILSKDTLRFCGIKSRGFNIGSSRELNKKQKTKIKKSVKKGLKYLIS